MWHDNWAWLPDECLLSIPELLFAGIALMGWSGHFVKCTNWATCKDSGHGMWWGLRKIASGTCNDKVWEKEGTSEIREANFFTAHLRRPRPRDGLDLPVSYDRARAEQDLAGCPDLEAEPLAPAYKVSVEKDSVMDSVCLCKAVQASTRSSGHRLENYHLFGARAGLPECCVFLTADFSQLYNVVIKSAIFIGFPPFLLLLSFPLF